MDHNTLRILSAQHVVSALLDQESAIIQTVKQAYESHARGESNLPHSSFLLFPDKPKNRIIGLPAYLGGDSNIAGIKWIASFPDNHALDLDRASAVIILNSVDTGRPLAILEGSVISKKRTAASAALAARTLHKEQAVQRVGLIGCGVINFEILRFLRNVYPMLHQIIIYDMNRERAEEFLKRCQNTYSNIDGSIADSSDQVFQQASLVSFATTAPQPYIHHLPVNSITSTILHISLRDLAPEIILQAINIVDDVDHVARAQTSIHLTELKVGHRNFINHTLAEITSHTAKQPDDAQKITIFSPFGLGILDLAVSNLVIQQALENELGTILPAFLPESWS